MAKDEHGDRVNTFGEITPSFDYKAAAKRAGLGLRQYWIHVLWPELLKLPAHTRRMVRDRAEKDIPNMVPVAAFRAAFNRFLDTPSAFPWGPFNRTYGASRRSMAAGLIAYLNRHIDTGGRLPRPLTEYLAHIIPGKLEDAHLKALCESLEYPHVLGRFTYHLMAEQSRNTKAQIEMDRVAKVRQRFAEPQVSYLSNLSEAHAAKVATITAALRNGADLKTFASMAWSTNPLAPQRKRPNLASALLYFSRHYAPALDRTTVTRIAEEARQYLTMIPQQAQPETYRVLTAMLYDDPMERRHAGPGV